MIFHLPLVCALSVASFNVSQPLPAPSSVELIEQLNEETLVAQYPIVATTRNSYRQNYSIGAVVTGNCLMNRCTVDWVTVDGKRVSHSWSYNDKAYKFIYGGETYYFTF